MDQGVIKNLKSQYRKELVQMTSAAIEDSLVSTTSTATDVSSKVTILDAIRFVAKSWRQVKAQTIANCFRKGGFQVVTASEEGTESGEAASLEAEEEPVLPEVVNGKSYLHIDKDIQCFNDEDVLEDDIIEAVSSKRPCQSEDGSEDEDSDPDEEVFVASTQWNLLFKVKEFT